MSSSPAPMVIRIARDPDLARCQVRVRAFARQAGLDERGCWELTIAVSEAASNMLKYAGGGDVVLRYQEEPRFCIEFEAQDRGEGISQLEHAVQDQVSEGSDLRESFDPTAQRGLGLGLGAISRMVDTVEILDRPGGGTLVRGRKWLPAE
ncbi:MAG: ATP-binding protein [Nannocystaceae bacterium]